MPGVYSVTMASRDRILTGYQRAYLLKKAHPLKPVVFLGRGGLTEGVLEAILKALRDHELVKLKFVDYKEDKRELSGAAAEATDSHLVRVIGNIAILYRPREVVDERSFHVPGWYDR